MSDTDYTKYSPTPKPPELTPPPSNKLLHGVLVLIRALGAWSYLLTTVWFLWLIVPTVLLNPFLRKMGVPNYWLPIDVATRWFAKGLLLFAGIRGVTEGVSREPTVLVSNHLSALDSFVVYAYSPISLRFIMKRTMMLYCPPLFVLARVIGCITINRQARQEAIEALRSAASKIKESHRSFVIFPEGTRSRTGTLGEFKKGAFHVAKDAGVTITPAIIFGTFDLWPPGTLFPLPGTIKVKVLDSIDTSTKSVEEILEESRKKIVQSIETDKFRVRDNGHLAATAPAMGWLIFLTGLVTYLWF